MPVKTNTFNWLEDNNNWLEDNKQTGGLLSLTDTTRTGYRTEGVRVRFRAIPPTPVGGCFKLTLQANHGGLGIPPTAVGELFRSSLRRPQNREELGPCRL